MKDENDQLLDGLGLENPDENQEQFFDWSDDFLQRILGSLISDRVFLLQSVTLIKPSYFRENAHRFICKVILDYYEKYNDRPDKTIIEAEITEQFKGTNHYDYYIAELDAICDAYEPGVEKREYFLDRILQFAKTQALRLAFNECLDIRKANKRDCWIKMENILQSVFSIERNVELGLDYFETIEDRYNRMLKAKESKEFFPTGFESFDAALGGGLTRGEMGAFAGMCFGEDVEVLMFDGSTKKVQDVEIGDLLMGDDSTPRRVLSLSTGIDQLYKVTPKKGDPYIVNSNHILSLKNAARNTKQIRKRKDGSFYVKLNALWHKSPYKVKGKDIFNIPVCDYLKQSSGFKSLMKGWRTGVEFPYKPVKVDPYILGVWLGDGHKHSPQITSMDQEVIDELHKEANVRGLVVETKDLLHSIISEEQSLNPPGKGESKNSFFNDLKSYGVVYNYNSNIKSGHKHIPMLYKVNSRQIRLELLAGLLDSDGHMNRNIFEFINKSKTLAEDVVYLARSLGLAAYMKPSEKSSQSGVKGLYWRVIISGDCSVIPVRICRKKASPRKQRKDVLLTGIKVEPIKRGRYYGFEVDKNHLFLLSDFTVTHNSGSGKSLGLVKTATVNLRKGWNVLYVTLEMEEDKIAERFDSMLTNVPIRSLYYGNKPDEVKGILNEGSPYWGKVVIKQFPAGTADVTTLRAFISQLHVSGFKPDCVFVDYVGEFKDLPGIKTYESRQRLVRDLRGLATELDVCIFTAMQVNRSGRDAMNEHGYIDDDALADSQGQVRPLDALWTISQTEIEQKANCGTIFASKHRSGRGRFMIRFYRDPDTLEMQEISQERYKIELSKVEDKAADELVMEDYARQSWQSNRGSGNAISNIDFTGDDEK